MQMVVAAASKNLKRNFLSTERKRMQREIFTMGYNVPKDEEYFGEKLQGLQDEIDRRNKIYGHKVFICYVFSKY